MITIVTCSNCRNPGSLPLVISFRRETPCKECQHQNKHDWQYHFCSLGCMESWTTAARKAGGVPCESCQSTGFRYMVRENGPCPECAGTEVCRLGLK